MDSDAAELVKRIEQITQIHDGGNIEILWYNCAEIARLLDGKQLSFDDFLPYEIVAIHYIFAKARGRKLMGGATPPILRLVPDGADERRAG